MSVRSAGEIFGEAETLALYLGIEVALAHAQAEVGVIPEDAAREIERGATLDAIDVPRVRQEAQRTGYAVAPLVRQLTEACGDAGRFVHWGATTQDIVNTALALQVDEAFRGVLERVERLARALAALVRSHRHSVMAGRTFGGHALPITFGFKAAVWLSSVLRHAERVRAAVARPIPGEFAGAEQGLAVRRAFMRRLRLPEPTITWAAMRDEVFVRVAALAGLTNSLAKIAQDIAELGSTEIGEVAEPHAGGKDTSSTLPLKANPILCAHTVAAATLVGQNAMSVLLAGRQRQERSGEALLELQVVGPAFIAAERCLDLAVLLLEDLQVFPSRMRRNLDGTRGVMLGERFMMALAPRLGRLQAHDLVHEACRAAIERDVPLESVLAEIPAVVEVLSNAELQALADPATYLGSADAMCAAVLQQASSVIPEAAHE
jgi:3-carboxy-cis,cis-muconate cycloisomerase